MKPSELRAECVQAIENCADAGLDPAVVLTLPKGKLPHIFPRGELLNEMRRGGVVERTYRFNPKKILAWLDKSGL